MIDSVLIELLRSEVSNEQDSKLNICRKTVANKSFEKAHHGTVSKFPLGSR